MPAPDDSPQVHKLLRIAHFVTVGAVFTLVLMGWLLRNRLEEHCDKQYAAIAASKQLSDATLKRQIEYEGKLALVWSKIIGRLKEVEALGHMHKDKKAKS